MNPSRALCNRAGKKDKASGKQIAGTKYQEAMPALSAIQAVIKTTEICIPYTDLILFITDPVHFTARDRIGFCHQALPQR
jgi:hypothetical protein